MRPVITTRAPSRSVGERAFARPASFVRATGPAANASRRSCGASCRQTTTQKWQRTRERPTLRSIEKPAVQLTCIPPWLALFARRSVPAFDRRVAAVLTLPATGNPALRWIKFGTMARHARAKPPHRCVPPGICNLKQIGRSGQRPGKPFAVPSTALCSQPKIALSSARSWSERADRAT